MCIALYDSNFWAGHIHDSMVETYLFVFSALYENGLCGVYLVLIHQAVLNLSLTLYIFFEINLSTVTV